MKMSLFGLLFLALIGLAEAGSYCYLFENSDTANGRHEYCERGCCGDGSTERHCCEMKWWLVITLSVCGFVAIVVVVVICCCYKYKKSKEGKVASESGTQVMTLQDMPPSYPEVTNGQGDHLPPAFPPPPPTYMDTPPAYSSLAEKQPLPSKH